MMLRCFVVLVLATAYCSGGTAKKPKPQPVSEERFSPTRKLAVSCSKAWPHVLATLLEKKFQILTSDREGGLITFKGQQTYPTETANTGFRHNPSPMEVLFRSFTIRHPYRPIYGYKIESSSILLIPDDQACDVQINIQILGLFDLQPNRAGLVPLGLESSGRLENGLLGAIEVRISNLQ